MELVVDGVTLLIDAEDHNTWWKYFSCLQYQHNRVGKIPCAVRLYKDGTYILLHRAILNPPAHLVVDHINGNPFDNRKQNLRICTVAENRWNSKTPGNKLNSLPKGIAIRKDTKQYRVGLTADGVKYYGGCWDTLEEAEKSLAALLPMIHRKFVKTS